MNLYLPLLLGGGVDPMNMVEDDATVLKETERNQGSSGDLTLLSWRLDMSSCMMVEVGIPMNNVITQGRCTTPYMGVSNNRGTPKWMVYNGKPY